MSSPKILITGATGFVGAKLLERLRADHPVRVIARDADKLDAGGGAVDVIEGDLGEDFDVARALEGIDHAYYLVHSMEPGEDDYADRDRKLAQRFARIAGQQGVGRIIFLGGVEPGGETSKHLESRNEVEEVLGSGDSELVALRTTMIVGAESDSFRSLAQIVDRLPVLALPTWRETRTQPMGIDDVTAALDAARDVAPGIYEVAGPDELTVEEMCAKIGELQGAPKRSIALPFSSTRLEGAAAAAVADSDRAVLEPLLAGLHEDLVVHDNRLQSIFDVTPTSFENAARSALAEMAVAAGQTS